MVTAFSNFSCLRPLVAPLSKRVVSGDCLIAQLSKVTVVQERLVAQVFLSTSQLPAERLCEVSQLAGQDG